MKMTRKVFISAIAITFLLSFNAVSATVLRQGDEPMNDATTNMKRSMPETGPRVCTTNIPMNENLSTSTLQFVERLDVLHIESDKDSDHAKVTFLAHSEEEMTSLSETSPHLIIQNDSETAQLNRYANMPFVNGQKSDTIPGFPCYRNLNGMFDMMDDLVSTASAIDSLDVTLTDIGDSYEKTVNSSEGYDIKALKITGNGVADKGWSTVKGIMFITCGVHAREYSPPELCARWAEKLVVNYGIDTEITTVLDHTEVHMIIESNPDGRYIAENEPWKYHRKNTRPGCPGIGLGVDLNRNFPFQWGYPGGSSTNQCDQTYRGTSPASEPEVVAIVEYSKSIFPEAQRKDDPVGEINDAYPEETTVGVAFDIHSYGNLIIWPFGYQETSTANEDSLQAAARKIKSFNNYALSGPNTPEFLYPASGVTDDYFYGELGAMAFTYELGTAFYQDCDTFEDTILPDNIPSLVYLAKVSSKPYVLVKGPDVTNASIPSRINYHPKTTLSISITVSDGELSAGPGNYPTTTQDIESISISVDMHPYDVDSNGDGPQIVTFPFEATPCTGVDFTVEVYTDNYPEETEWYVKDSEGNIVMESDFMADPSTFYETTECLNDGDYEFEITDSYGDGICCGFSNGFYTLKIGDITIASGGNFGSSEIQTFTVVSPLDSPDVSRNFPSTTWTKSVNAPLSKVATILKDPLIGEHIIYSQGTDSDGYIGPVKASSFEITCIDAISIPINGKDLTCEFLASRGFCDKVQLQILCPSTCDIC